MFSIFRRPKDAQFNIAAIGDNWLVRPLTHDGVQGTLHVRQVPSDVQRKRFSVVALSWVDRVDAPQGVAAISHTVKEALERDGRCLLVLTHETPERVTWYAYAASAKALDEAFSSLSNSAIRWGVNDDKGWLEYEHAKGMVGA